MTLTEERPDDSPSTDQLWLELTPDQKQDVVHKLSSMLLASFQRQRQRHRQEDAQMPTDRSDDTT
jgi:predicted Fe-S protein YdhL (DUF1289 family)